MGNKDLNSKLITDDGLIFDDKTKQARIFVVICNILSFCLIVLGVIAFIKGNF